MTNFLQVVSFDPLLIENTTPGTVPGPTGPQGPPGPPGTGSGAGLPSNIVSQSVAYTAAANDFVEATTTSAGFTVTLPASPAAGALVAVKKVSSDTNTLTIAASGGGTIDGQATLTTITQWAGVVLEHKASNVWRVAASMSTTGPAGTNGTNGANGSNGTNGAISLIQDEGSALTVRPTINFVGAGVTATDDAANTRTVVTITGSAAPTPIGAPVQVYAAQTVVNNTSMSVNPTAGIPAGATVFLFYTGQTETVTGVTDSKGNTWTVDHICAGSANNSGPLSIASGKITTALLTSDTITVAWSAGGNIFRNLIIEYATGIASSSPFDKSADANAFANTITTPDSTPLAQANELCWFAVNGTSSIAGWVHGAGWADATPTTFVGNIAVSWRVAANITPVNGTATLTTNHVNGTLVTYKGN